MSSYIFTGSGFSLVSAEWVSARTIRIRFSALPKASDPTDTTDALRPANYTLQGEGVLTVTEVSATSDLRTFDLETNIDIPNGTWSVTATNVSTPTGLGLEDDSVNFYVSAYLSTAPSQGLKNLSPADVIRRHFALPGENWDKLIDSLAVPDQMNLDDARATHDQLFVATAEGQYLDSKGNGQGAPRPANVGMDDDTYRKLITELHTGKVVHESLKKLLEIFYGRDAFQGYVESKAEPFALDDGLDLTWVVDGKRTYTHTLSGNEFEDIAAATAQELSNVLTQAMALTGKDFACVQVDPETGENHVRIYSGSLGLASTVKVTGGTAQPFIQFPTLLDTYPGDATGETWVYTNPFPGVTKATLTSTGIPGIDVETVQAGDYVVIASSAGVGTSGWWELQDVTTEWTSPTTYVQTFTVADLDFVGSANIASNADYTFFRPTTGNTYQGARTVSVTQHGNELQVILPATSDAVTREVGNAWYLAQNAESTITRLYRDQFGVVHVNQPGHGLQTGQSVDISGYSPSPSYPYALPEITDRTAASHMDWISGDSLSGLDVTYNRCRATTMGNNQSLFVGGRELGSGPYKADAVRTEIRGTGAVVSDTEANGALRARILKTATASLATARVNHGISNVLGGALVTGGHAGSDPLDSAEQYDYTADTWTTVSPMLEARKNHAQVTLQNGKVLVCGGSKDDYNATNTVELFDPVGNAWVAQSPMNFPRTNHTAVLLGNGNVLVAGGRTLGMDAPLQAATEAWWKLDETSGTTAADATGNGATATDGGTATIPNAVGKVNRSRQWVGGSYMTATPTADTLTWWSDPPGVTQNIIDFWFKEGGTGTVITLSGSGASETEVNNTLVQIAINPDNTLTWLYEKGAGVNVTNTTTDPVCPTLTGKWYQIAYEQRTPVDGVTEVRVWCNGYLVQTWTGLDSPTGGSSAVWTLGADASQANSWVGYLDQIRYSHFQDPASADNAVGQYIHRNFFYECGDDHEDAENYSYLGRLWATAEIFTPGGGWSLVGDMGMARSGHASAVTQDTGGYIAYVSGGSAHSPTYGEWSGLSTVPPDTYASFVWPTRTLDQPNGSTNTTEQIDTFFAEAFWVPWTPMVYPRAQHAMLWVGEDLWQVGDKPWALEGGVSTKEVNGITGPTSFSMANGQKESVVNSGVIILGGGNYNYLEYLLPAAHTNSSKGINGSHVVEVVDADNYTFSTDTLAYTSNYGGQFSQAGNINTQYAATNQGSRTSNVVTLEVTNGGGSGEPLDLNVGDSIYVNISAGGLGSGIRTILSVTDTTASFKTITYAETGANVASATQTGSVSILYSTPSTLTYAAPAVTYGSYVVDLNAPATFETISTEEAQVTVTQAIHAGAHAQFLHVSDAFAFDPDGGSIVLDFGNTSLEMHYTAIIESNEPDVDDKLLLDFGYVFPVDVPVGTTVNIIDNVVPVANPAILTASSAGRVAAERIMGESVSAGVDLNIDVIYPGDRGLGAEGSPTENAQKLSDQVTVWAGDDLATELAKRRGDK